ncbi:hypothetical protein PF005_g1867 [Phytophthora fragariae]|uniref:Putative zinc-finger domain-containing protein n=1 Tax=Phytophthora fragariae TaxID=53985 RepID=A0A6A3TEG1_9STRA|nr:hypothetical protein PF009_g2688 [Phytophthora fragariae]KAE9135486.1 hypothetical protein PF007_g2547 [Phytophthora fragariae]KAE9234483.1 hypothetical protein PF005_g1867 [Phytophthora fragariae]KAE9327878.1 hypothetical protein PF001_g1722 [Phytophthora fragariae]
MRMEVGEASATAAAAEGAVGPDAAQKAVERIRELEAERQQWIAKRQQTLARQEKLLKLLELQRATKSKGEQNAGDTANNETKTPPADDQKTENEEARTAAATAALARKKELKELQARALAAQEKQQQAASVLARNLKQLVTRNAQRSQAIKRKREEEQEAADNQPSKKIDVGVDKDEATASTPEMHPFAAGSDVDVGTTELAAAACFRIALRHLVQTGTVMSKEKLEQEFNTYTGKQSGEVIDSSLLEFSLADVNTVGSIQAGNPSSSSTRVEPVCWQPGRQYLKIPTVCSSQADRIQALIDVEKQVVVDACDSLWMEKRCLSSTSVICKRRQKQFMACLLGEDVAAPNSATLSTVLSACVGVNPNRSTTSYEKRFPYQVYGQIASVFAKMEAWLRDRATKSEPNNSLSLRLDEGNRHRSSRDNFFSSKYAKPFSVSSDSVVKQLRDIGSLHSAVAKKLDPMKILCHYELNGVCNDKNCSNYHQNDYEPVVINSKESSDGNDGDDFAKVLQMDEMDQLLLSFAEFRGRIMTKWPVIPTSQNSSVTTEKNTGTNATDARLSAIEPELSMARDSQRRDGDSEGSNDDFLELDIPAELPALGDARYFDDVESRNLYGDSLQGKVEEDPNDTDAWLLLAIYYLDLDVGLSDEAANLSGDDRLQQQLVFLCKELNVVHRSGSSRKLNIEESNLKRCLHTLSRALEVEANAYCEALWLLYLHLCGQVASKQTEIDTVEQAVQFLPSSHALWLRYVSTYDFDSVGMAEGIYWRLLEHLARVNSGEDGLQVSNVSPKKELSILLTAICFHLCIKLWRAGATRRVLELLSALLQIGDATSEFAWCNMHDHVDSFPWREHQAGLAKLFRKYMSEMSVEAQMFRQVSKQIKDDVERNAVEDAVCDCLYPERHQLITYDVNIELFRLCLAAVAGSEQTTFYASFTDSLGQSSEFSLAFSDAAVHEWELLAARASLRKCLGRAKAQHPQILQALVAVELRLRNMKAVSSLLESEMQAEPLLLESWRLAVGLEILFGEQLDERSQKIAAEMEKRQLVFACNTYGDDKLSSEGTLSMLRNSEATSLSLRGLRLTFVPNAVLLNNELVSLNLSGNELTELPMGLGRLKNLRKLDASENGLIGFPECVNKLTQLQELRLAHNNIYAVSIHALPRLITMDIRWNAIAHLSASTLAALQNLIMLHIEGNAVPDDQLAKFFDLLSRRKHGIASREDQTNSIVQTEEIPRSVLAGDKSLPEKPSHKKVTLSSADANTEVADKIIDSEMTAAEVVATELETKEDDGDQVVEQDIVSTVSASKDKAGQLTENVDQTSPPIESNEDQAMSAADTATVSMEGGDDQSMGNSNSVIEIDDAIPVSVGDATKEVIDVDSSESAEETEDSNNITELTVDATRDVLVPSTNAEPSGSSATGNFERSHSDAVLAAAPRRHSSIARTKLAVYMKNNHVDGRAEARRRNPALWGEFVAANLPVQSVLPACRWCFAPNDGRNQRFNSTVLCVRCLEDAVRVLKEREGSLDVGQNGF